MMNSEVYIRQAEGFSAVSDEGPRENFLNFYDRHRKKIGTILLGLKQDDRPTGEFTIRVGMMPPGSAVIDERIMDFCRLPYRTPDGVISSCPGILYDWKGCPPYSPPVSETVALLERAVSFLIVQLDGDQGHERQGEVHPFIDRMAAALLEAGYSVLDMPAAPAGSARTGALTARITASQPGASSPLRPVDSGSTNSAGKQRNILPWASLSGRFAGSRIGGFPPRILNPSALLPGSYWEINRCLGISI